VRLTLWLTRKLPIGVNHSVNRYPYLRKPYF
jgi:hypothetical protein